MTLVQGILLSPTWVNTMTITGSALSMAVNALMTGLIVFKILKVLMEVKAITVTSVGRTLGSTGGTKLQHTIFIIIESGLALFAIQLVRLVLYCLWLNNPNYVVSNYIIYYLPIGIHQMFNVIIRSVHLYFFCFTDNIYLA